MTSSAEEGEFPAVPHKKTFDKTDENCSKNVHVQNCSIVAHSISYSPNFFSSPYLFHNNTTQHRGAINSHPGNVAFRRLVHQHRTTYFAPTTRKLDKARIAKEIMAQVHALPGRFLKKDGKTGKWLEINEKKAKKKIGQAFRDRTPHDERSRIGAGLLGEGAGGDDVGDGRGADAERPSDDDDDESEDFTYEYDQDVVEGQALAATAAGYYPQDDTYVTATTPHMASASDLAHRHTTSIGGRKRQHSFDDSDLPSDGKESVAASDRPCISTPPLPPLPAPQPPSSLRHSSTGTCSIREEQQSGHGLPPAAHAVGFRPIAVQRANSAVQDDTALSHVDMSGMVATYNAHMQHMQQASSLRLPLPHGHYSRHSSHASNAEPSSEPQQHKTTRLPASEFALYPDAKSAADDNIDAGVATAAAPAAGSASTDGQQSRRGSTESTELEKLTMELLVKRARTWEELYYSEREYSRSLEDRMVGLLGNRVARQQMPKRRRVGDSDALAA